SLASAHSRALSPFSVRGACVFSLGSTRSCVTSPPTHRVGNPLRVASRDRDTQLARRAPSGTRTAGGGEWRKGFGKRTRTMMAQSDKRKQSLYFPESMLQEIQQEAARLDRSLSWVMQRAWKIA